jgi:16S rRNA (uracil1498-N3)-methyltransferase
MEYFYAPPERITSTAAILEGDERHHLVRVMRIQPGDRVRIVDGAGSAFDAVVQEISQRTAVCTITASHRLLNEPGRTVTLAVGVLKNPSRFDYLVEKTVELGVSKIVPLLTERSIRKGTKVDRWRSIALAAMKQCGRCILPSIAPPTPFDAFLLSSSADAEKIMPHEKAEAGELHILGQDIIMCIGPEGGFSDSEVQRAVNAGFKPVTLGPRRLRAETAAVVATAIALL